MFFIKQPQIPEYEGERFTDSVGRLINKDGRFIDNEGGFINDEGKKVDKDGNVVLCEDVTPIMPNCLEVNWDTLEDDYPYRLSFFTDEEEATFDMNEPNCVWMEWNGVHGWSPNITPKRIVIKKGDVRFTCIDKFWEYVRSHR